MYRILPAPMPPKRKAAPGSLAGGSHRTPGTPWSISPAVQPSSRLAIARRQVDRAPGAKYGEAEAEDVRGLRPQASRLWAGVGGEGAMVRGVWDGGGGGAD